MVMTFAGAAYANFGPHGAYALDTDACAGCHRAHTSFSDVQWTDTDGWKHDALLVSSAKTMEEFCYACHGNDAPGASTNVEYGVFDGGPSAASGGSLGGGIAYLTNSSLDATLNGGGFKFMPSTPGNFAATTSQHNMIEGAGPTAPVWGFGASVSAAAGAMSQFTCTDCHDPHGSSNYRLLKDALLGGTKVGGYDSATGLVPDPFVISNEEGYPVSGWLKHNDGSVQVADYKPNYTDAEYARQGSMARGVSGWCAGCHTEYNVTDSAYDYSQYETDTATGASVGSRTRHRHPMNVDVAKGPSDGGPLTVDPVIDSKIPLEMAPGTARGVQDTSGWIGCLTCHRAHGTTAEMTGWAESKIVNKPSAVTTWTVERLSQPAGNSGVNPNFSSALLRADNRGVCERCHNK